MKKNTLYASARAGIRIRKPIVFKSRLSSFEPWKSTPWYCLSPNGRAEVFVSFEKAFHYATTGEK